ncbi:MAG TPA: pyridoxamine 5'-phosphate oxidase family protein [Anaeromyxobacteraceae bacterium]|nr:pyridoxamine 5'-phosphate oxidase family protein [Anaeromyxobacteraceae bacterium]
MQRPSSDVAFTESVKAVQARKGSRSAYARLEARGGFETEITEELAAFVAERDSFYVATASAAGRPYVQHRGGPKGFLRVLDARTLGWADVRGNRQYVTTGNLAENDQAFLFLMDYATRTRVKVWGRARVVDDDPALLARLAPEGRAGVPEQAVIFAVAAWDANCPQHIPRKLDAAEVEPELARLRDRVAALEAENAALKAGRAGASGAPGAAARPPESPGDARARR